MLKFLTKFVDATLSEKIDFITLCNSSWEAAEKAPTSDALCVLINTFPLLSIKASASGLDPVSFTNFSTVSKLLTFSFPTSFSTILVSACNFTLLAATTFSLIDLSISLIRSFWTEARDGSTSLICFWRSFFSESKLTTSAFLSAVRFNLVFSTWSANFLVCLNLFIDSLACSCVISPFITDFFN